MSNPNAPENTRSHRREKAASDALRSLIRDTLQDHFPALSSQNEALPLQLAFTISCADQGELRFDPPLRQQILEQADALLKPRESYLQGTAYDFHEQSHRLPACRPPDALSVFTGYGPLGHPQWSPLPELPPMPEGFRQYSGKELKTEQLPDYGKDDKTYNILGQLVLGSLDVPQAYQTLTHNPTFALTVQVVETRDARAHFALKCNLLIGGLLPDELWEMLQEPALRPLGLALQELDTQIQQLEILTRDAWENQDMPAFNRNLKVVPVLLSEFTKGM